MTTAGYALGLTWKTPTKGKCTMPETAGATYTAEDVHAAYTQGRRDAAKDTQAYTQGWADGHNKAVANAADLASQRITMTPLPGNPYVTEADLSTQVLHDWMEREGETDATMLATALGAQTQATLALAYEQRTANIIAYATARFADGSAMFPADIDGAREVIYARLGLDGDGQ